MHTRTANHRKSIAGRGVFPAKYAFTLLIPLRNIFLSPKRLLERLDIRKDHSILEIGPGPGYFSTHVAKELSAGRLTLIDVQQEMLDICRSRMEKRCIDNVEYRVTDGAGLDLETAAFDRAYMVTVIGEIENKDVYLQEIHRGLKEDGILSITELAGDPDKMSIEELSSLVCRYGFEVEKTFGNRRNYTVNFRKTGSPPLPAMPVAFIEE